MPKVTTPIPVSKLKAEATFKPKQMSLPTKPTEGIKRIEFSKLLFVGPPGWGKTELAMSNPNSILLACEEGHAAITGYKLVINGWKGTEPFVDKQGIQHCAFVDAVAMLQNEHDKFDTIIIDTFDALIKMLLDYELPKRRVEHATDLGDYGKGWDLAQNTPFRREFNKLLKTGRGVIGITHEKVQDKSFAKGLVSKKETTLPKGIYDQIFAQFDTVLHGSFGKVRKPNKIRDRLLYSEGSEHMLAKNRGGYFPPAWIVPVKMEDRWKQFSEFFSSEKAREKAFNQFLDAGYELE